MGRRRLSIGWSERGRFCILLWLSRALELFADDRGVLRERRGLLRDMVLLLSLLLWLLVLHSLGLLGTGHSGLITLLDLVTLFDRPG